MALTSCTVPAAGKPTFELGETEMEIGIGIHGEPGRYREPLARRARSPSGCGPDPAGPPLRVRTSRCSLFVNGFGGTPLLELYLMYDAAARRFLDRARPDHRALAGWQLRDLSGDGRLLDHAGRDSTTR